MKTVKITNPEQIKFYLDNGLTPINVFDSYGKLVYEFNRDEQNWKVYRKWHNMKREHILKRYAERRKEVN